MAHKIESPGAGPGAATDEPGKAEKPHQFGLTAAMALIVGSIIGVGIFNLPTSLAAYGPITLVSMALTTVDFFSDPTHIQKARAEFDRKRGPGFVYKTRLADRKPALDYRK